MRRCAIVPVLAVGFMSLAVLAASEFDCAPASFTLHGGASVSPDGKRLLIDSIGEPKAFTWRRYAVLDRAGRMAPHTRNRLTFKVKAEATDHDAHLLALIRPRNENSHHYDCGSATVLPTQGRWKTVEMKFATRERDDCCFQLHSRNRIKAEVKDITLVKAEPLKFEAVRGESSRVDVDMSAEPRGAEEFDVDRPSDGNGLVLNAADFGVSETNADNTAALRAALAAAKERRAARLVLPRGAYRVASNSPLSLDGFTDFTFDGGGSTFVTYRKSGAFLDIKGCTRVRLCDFALDWDWSRTPLASLVEVSAKHGTTADFTFRDYADFPDKEALFTCASPFDPVTRSVGLEGRHTLSFGSYTGNKRSADVSWIAPNTVRLPVPAGGVEVGQLFRLQHYYYHMGGVVMEGNAHVRLERIRVRSTPGHAFRIGGAQHHTLFRDVDIVAPPDDPRRIITCTGDHLHLSNSRGFIKLENCEFSLGADDIFNMHDNSAYAEKTGGNSLRVLNSPLYAALPAGTVVELRKADYSPAGMSATVSKTTRLGARVADVVFQENLPGEIGDGFILFDRRYDTRNVIVRGCRFHDNRGRGLLILARDVTVENNVFRHHESGAIKIETGYTLNHWSEGYGVSNVVVRNNVFDYVNPSGRPAAHRQRSIYTGIYLKTDPSLDTTSYPIIRDVLFVGNEFRESTGVAAYLTSIRNVTFRDNLFTDAVPRKHELPYRAQFYLENAHGAKILNNTWIESACVKAPGVEWDPIPPPQRPFSGI